MGRLTTHILDTAHGCPAAGVAINLYRLDGSARELLAQQISNGDGRCDAPLLAGDSMRVGVYELEFAIGDYFVARGLELPRPAFVDRVLLRFGISDANAHYHVPLLASPYSYSTYRGS
jgi:5-hydroxyisourate hydrolase